MKLDTQHQPPTPPDDRADARLWDVLGQTSAPELPPDFLQSVMQRVEDLEQTRTERRAASLWEQLTAGWQQVFDAVAVRMNVAGGLVASFGLLALFTGLVLLPGLNRAQKPAPLVTTEEQPAETSLEADTLADLYAMNDVEVETILQLDDYLAFADQQVWLDNTSTGVYE